MMRTGSESPTGGVEAPVLEGAASVMVNEGHGLGEAEEGSHGGSSGKLDAL